MNRYSIYTILFLISLNAKAQEKFTYFTIKGSQFEFYEYDINLSTKNHLFTFDEYPTEFIYNSEDKVGYYVYKSLLAKINTASKKQQLISNNIPFAKSIDDNLILKDLYIDRFTGLPRICQIYGNIWGDNLSAMNQTLKVFEITDNQLDEVESFHINCSYLSCDLSPIYDYLYPDKSFINYKSEVWNSLKKEQYKNGKSNLLGGLYLKKMLDDNSQKIIDYKKTTLNSQEGDLKLFWRNITKENESKIVYSTFGHYNLRSQLVFLVDDSFFTRSILKIDSNSFTTTDNYVIFYNQESSYEHQGVRPTKNSDIYIYDSELNLIETIKGFNVVSNE